MMASELLPSSYSFNCKRFLYEVIFLFISLWFIVLIETSLIQINDGNLGGLHREEFICISPGRRVKRLLGGENRHEHQPVC